MEFIIKTPAGCPGGGVGIKSSSILMYVVLIFTLYAIVGTIINIKTQNKHGKEAIPNIEFYRSLPDLIQEGMTKTLIYSKEKIQLIKGKIKGNSNSYNDL